MATSPLSFGVILNSQLSKQFSLDPATTTGLTFGFKAGDYSNGTNEINVSAGTVALSDDTTQTVILNRTSGTVSVGVSSDSTTVVLYTVTTASGAITDIIDRRAAYI